VLKALVEPVPLRVGVPVTGQQPARRSSLADKAARPLPHEYGEAPHVSPADRGGVGTPPSKHDVVTIPRVRPDRGSFFIAVHVRDTVNQLPEFVVDEAPNGADDEAAWRHMLQPGDLLHDPAVARRFW